MARALRIQYPGASYHVTCRGNERKAIFKSQSDIVIFLEKLSDSLEIYSVILLAYVCMPNHFHLLVKTPKANLSEFMRHFNICYTGVFNRNHRRVGHLYQGRYKSLLIDADSYLLEVSRYIHLNPVRTKEWSEKDVSEKKIALMDYSASSLMGYLYPKQREKYVDYEIILDQVGGDDRYGREEYRKFVMSGLDGELESPLGLGRGHGIVGEDAFITQVKTRHLTSQKNKREQPAVKVLEKVIEPEELIKRFFEINGKSRGELLRRGKYSVDRSMLMALLYELCGMTQPEIGKLMGGIDYSAVSQSRKRLRQKCLQEPKLQKRFDQIKFDLVNLPSLKI
ncbi:MAG: hypothetical protein EHM45_13645 [Desulfobacteraceae bacterium]|nr:MAG: hypothetical protein EHM45_13645 [Desulfobacteraceae bacterium]